MKRLNKNKNIIKSEVSGKKSNIQLEVALELGINASK